MKRSSLGWLVLVGLLVAADWRSLMAPGAVGRAHDSVGGDCDSCHLAFDGVPDARCLDCHEGLAAKQSEGRGYHASVSAQPCIACHTDHKGLDGDLTRAEARAAFSHDATGFGLGGAHGALSCADCHEGPIDAMAPSCGGCHDDPHSSALGLECQSCHVDTGWAQQLKTLAAHLVPTDGGHSGLGCEDCHVHGEHLSPSVPCKECHEDGHGGTTANCDQCHEVAAFKPAQFDHGPCTCAFPGKHQTVECLACHPDFSFVDTPTLCSGCHTDDRPHEPLGECSRCHTASSWSEGRFDHDTSAFRLDGSHLSVSCNQCHERDGGTQFRGVPSACEGCHQAAGDAAHGDFGACARCHTTAGFDASTFDHASVGFPLSGRHAEAGCQSCHAQKTTGYRPL